MSFNDRNIPTVIDKLSEEITALLDYNDHNSPTRVAREHMFEHINAMLAVMDYYGGPTNELKERLKYARR
jgi:hypothetical protein